ncbi:MAG: cell division protein ZapA [Acidobacteriota bacterium]|nr:cell division protein ZapA [Acidobacteriota bacterium]
MKIYNQTYQIRGESNADYIRELAEYVDKRMKEVAEETMTADSLRVAILTALNIADELHKVRDRLEQLDASLIERSKECSELLDTILTKPRMP